MNMLGSVGALASSVLFPFFFGLTNDIKSYFFVAAILNAAAMAGWGLVLNESKPALETPTPFSVREIRKVASI